MTTASLPVGTVRGTIRVPGSKSVALRALALAAMAHGTSQLTGMADGEDPTAMLRAVRAFGASVHQEPGTWTVTGGAFSSPSAEIDVGESGLTARVSIAMSCLVDNEVTITGRGRLLQRPMGPLLDALRALGVEVRGQTDHLPVTVRGRGRLRGGRVAIDTSASTQFASALLLAAPISDSPVEVEVIGSAGASGYVRMTLDLMSRFGVEVTTTDAGYAVPVSDYRPADVDIPPDASSAAYPLVAAAITGGEVEVSGLTLDDGHPDIALVEHLVRMGCETTAGPSGLILKGPDELEPSDADMSGAPDGALALAVACLFAAGTSRIGGLATLRHKESDRIESLTEGLTRLGARVWVSDDSVEITPVALRGAVVRSHGDHRIAMALALAGLRLEGVEVEAPGVVAKTWPDYWEAMHRLVFSET